MKLDKSRQLWERSKRSLAGGVSSQVRMGEYPFPLFFERAKGSRIYDADGNEYIDYVLGQGPDIFGHAPDFLQEAVAGAMQRGQVFGAQHELEISVSEMVQKTVPSAELVRFSSSGTEVVQAALRLARAYTGRTKFIKFEGHYHGWLDSVLYSTAPALGKSGAPDSPVPVPGSSGMSPGSAGEIIVLPWNDVNAVRRALDREGDDVAAILTEPIMFNTNCIIPRPGYLEEIRALCDERGVVLIFDEVITGFRVAKGGAQQLLDVTPDLSTFAKAMGGGFPVSMLAGKKDIMTLVADGTALHAGTVNSNVMAMAATEASLSRLLENDGAVCRKLYSIGTALIDGLQDSARKHEVPLLVQGPGPIFALTFTDAPEIYDYRSHAASADRDKYAKFRSGMFERGVRLKDGGGWFVSSAHTEEDVEQTLAAADEVLASI